jgi:hypothetical protein
MAKSSSKTAGRSKRRARATSASSRGRSARNGGGDAIALLKSDHREVEGLFEQFEKARSDDRKQELADKICTALKAHTMIEEEIFYPAFLEATDETDLHHEAAVEHDGAKKLIAEIEAAGPDDEYYDAKVTVLSEMIKHHVNEEEQRGGMFAKARDADMDLAALGEQMKKRKQEALRELGDGSGRGGSSSRRRGGVAAALLGRNSRSQDGVRRNS